MVVRHVPFRKKNWLEPPVKPLIPVKNPGLHLNPEMPTSPLNCEEYRSSPFCRMPGQFDPFTLYWHKDKCNFVIELQLGGYWNLPTQYLVYRENRPECIYEYPPMAPVPPPPAAPSPPVRVPRPGAAGCACVAVFACWSINGFDRFPGVGRYYIKSFFGDTGTPYIKFIGNPQEFRIYGEGVFTYTAGMSNNITIYYSSIGDWEDEPEGDVKQDYGQILYSCSIVYTRADLVNDFYLPVPSEPGFPFELIYTFCSECPLPPRFPDVLPPPPPSPPQSPGDPNMPSCCPETNDLLNLLLAKVNKLSQVVGVADYPISVPESFISKDEGFLGNLIPNLNKDIPSLTRFLHWYIERFDEILGQWEIPIEVKDSDPTTPGDQPVGFKLSNLAEAVGEIFGLLLQSTINTESLINICTRSLIETGSDKQQNFKSFMLLQAIADFLNFEVKDTKHKLPMTFDITQENLDSLDKFLKEKEIDVSAVEFSDQHSLKDQLHELLQAAAIIRAVHFRRVDPKQDIKQQLMNLIKNAAASEEKLNNSEKDENGKDDWDRFIEDVEVGFTTYPGVSDPSKPYGTDYESRPRVREIGDTVAE